MMQKEFASKKESLYNVERQKSYILRQKGSKLHSIIYHCYLHPVTSSCQFDTIQHCYPYPNIDKYDYHYIALYDILDK